MILAWGFVNKPVEEKRESRNRSTDPHIWKLHFREGTLQISGERMNCSTIGGEQLGVHLGKNWISTMFIKINSRYPQVLIVKSKTLLLLVKNKRIV